MEFEFLVKICMFQIKTRVWPWNGEEPRSDRDFKILQLLFEKFHRKTSLEKNIQGVKNTLHLTHSRSILFSSHRLLSLWIILRNFPRIPERRQHCDDNHAERCSLRQSKDKRTHPSSAAAQASFYPVRFVNVSQRKSRVGERAHST